jgi:hypothetical protein
METPREHLPAGRPVAGASGRSTLRAVWTVHALSFGPHHARRCPVVRARVLEQSGRRLASGEPCHGTRSERASGRARHAVHTLAAGGAAGRGPHRSWPVRLCGRAMAG